MSFLLFYVSITEKIASPSRSALPAPHRIFSLSNDWKATAAEENGRKTRAHIEQQRA